MPDILALSEALSLCRSFIEDPTHSAHAWHPMGPVAGQRHDMAIMQALTDTLWAAIDLHVHAQLTLDCFLELYRPHRGRHQDADLPTLFTAINADENRLRAACSRLENLCAESMGPDL